VLLDAVELPEHGALTFSWRRMPFAYRRGPATVLQVQTAQGWRDCPDLRFDPQGVLAVRADVAVG